MTSSPTGGSTEASTSSSSSGSTTDPATTEDQESSSTTEDVVVFPCPDDPLALELSTVDPQVTDAEISASPLHFYAEPPDLERGELLLFLPGSNAPPSAYQMILQVAAAGGYHAIGLAYRNEVNLNDACIDGPSVCEYNARREIVYGANTSLYVVVSRPDSIANRLVRALQHLGWDDYLDEDDTPRWSSIAVAGHSQGAGHAALVAAGNDIPRALMFSGTEPAEWTEEPTTTPTERIFGFVHEDDESYDGMILSWAQLEIPGVPTSVDAIDPPYGSQQLTTSVAPAAGNPHGSPATDADTPLNAADLPVYLPTWCAMLGLEAD